MEKTAIDHLLRLGLACLVAFTMTACGDDDSESSGGDDDAMDSGMEDSGMDPEPDSSMDDVTDSGVDDDTDSGPVAPADLAINGDYTDGWGSHRISNDSWIMGWTPTSGAVAISEYDNDAMFAVGQNDSNTYDPDKWSRFDWTWDGTDLYYCQTEYAADSEADALAATQADATDLAAGCNGFGWSLLTAGEGPLAIGGEWGEGGAGTHSVGDTFWATAWGSSLSLYELTQFSNSGRYAIAHNDTNNDWNADDWSRFDWTWDDGGMLYYCQTRYDAATEDEALSATPADVDDLATGCAGSPWSAITMGQSPIAIIGIWTDGAAADHTITPDNWTIGSDVFALGDYTNIGRYVVAQNATANAANGDLFSLFDWTWDDADDLWYCQTISDAADADAASGTTAADATDLGTGCVGGAWSKLTAVQ